MAHLERIRHTPMRLVILDGIGHWERDVALRVIDELPQIFWDDGSSWLEANHWALTKATGITGSDPGTVKSLMKHLCDYANWLEFEHADWRHFPVKASAGTLPRYRGELIARRKNGLALPSTTTARMNAVIQFYRHAFAHALVGRRSPLWRDELVVIRYFDDAGFSRAVSRVKSELAIPNRTRAGEWLEDGLTSISINHAKDLLSFTASQNLDEMNLMLSLGFFTGARIGSISTFSVRNIEGAMPDESMHGFHRLPVGPGTGIETKFDVSASLLVPSFLIQALKQYAYSMRRLKRQALASKDNRGILFLTTRGNSYGPQTFNRLMTDLRRRAMLAGLTFMKSFKFHQSRCTYGTWIMTIALGVTNEANALSFTKNCMLHKKESATLRYIRFIQKAPIKALMANEFTAAFSGISNRDWSKFEA